MIVLKVISLIVLIPIELVLILAYLIESKEVDSNSKVILILMTIFIMPIIYICMA